MTPAPAPTSTAYSSRVVNNEGGGQTTVYDVIPPAATAPAPTANIAPPVAPPVPLAPPPPPVAPVNSMPSAALGTNASTFSTYTPKPTAAVNLSESAVASKDAAIKGVADEAAALKTEQTAGKKSLTDIFSRISGQATKKVNAEEDAGLNNDKRAIDELTSNIESVGRSFDKQIEAIQKNNPTGMLDPGVQIEVNRLQQQKASTQADFAIVLNAKTRNYDTAKSIIDTKVDAETEDLKNSLAGLQFFYQENAGNLDKDQQVVLQDKITTANQALQDARDMRTKIGDLQLTAAKNGAPVSVVRAIGAAADFETATGVASGYLKAANASTDAYAAADARQIKQAGLAGASQRVKDMYVNTPPAFQAAFILNGSGSKDVTPEQLLKSVSDWEAQQKDGDVNNLISALKSGS